MSYSIHLRAVSHEILNMALVKMYLKTAFLTSCGSGHETAAGLLPGFAINW